MTFQKGSGGGGSSTRGAILAQTSYNPAGGHTYTLTGGGSNTFADVDTTNLAVTFTAPASGNVNVRLEIVVDMGGSTTNLWWTVAGGGTAVPIMVIDTVNAQTAVYWRMPGTVLVTGLTAGTSYTLTWQWAQPDTNQSSHMYVGGTAVTRGGIGPGIMTVYGN